MAPIKAVLFDFMGTCLDWHTSIVAALPASIPEDQRSQFALEWRQAYFDHVGTTTSSSAFPSPPPPKVSPNDNNHPHHHHYDPIPSPRFGSQHPKTRHKQDPD